ncbi:unnamed protein product [Enterobius vermicularis]|uniref:E3 ubiquitin-protein ligase n=1 Tax=Enterobius vermicularis TaxID=51028 RepID=A0A0N4VCT8_ENTVE|nr:unnamed protein product [Enterobius vermicularis]
MNQAGDITKAVSDAYIVPCDTALECSNGAAQAVVRAGGSYVMDTLQVLALESDYLYHGQMVALHAGSNLDTWYVLLVCLTRKSAAGLTECYRKGFEAAVQRKLAAVALTGFGTGRLGGTAKDSARAAFSAIFESGLNFDAVKSIRIIDSNAEVVEAFQQCFSEGINNMADVIVFSNNENSSEHFGTKGDEDVRKSMERFIKVIPSPSNNAFVCNGSYKGNMDADDVCAICYDKLFRNDEDDVVVQLKKCCHAFHRSCLEEAFCRLQERCPICKRWYNVPKGNQPAESTMTVTKHAGQVSGFPDADGYYCIEYILPGGVQTYEHPRPGLRYSGVRRYAYLPSTSEGKKILELFKLAFSSRLMFTVGDCETGRRNVVIFNGIHNKTSLSGGPEKYGFPDPQYFDRVKRELAAVGITEQLLETSTDW